MFNHSARNANGYAIWSNPDGKVEEKDTLQCVHCGAHWMVEPGSGIKRGYCLNCNGPHCGSKQCHTCIPLEKFIDTIERKARSDYYTVE